MEGREIAAKMDEESYKLQLKWTKGRDAKVSCLATAPALECCNVLMDGCR